MNYSDRDNGALPMTKNDFASDYSNRLARICSHQIEMKSKTPFLQISKATGFMVNQIDKMV